MAALDKDGAEAAAKRLGAATVAAVRGANELPTGRDYVLSRSSSSAFQARVAGPKGNGGVEKRVLVLLDRIFAHVGGEPSSFARKKGGAEPDDVFDAVVDFADSRLEAVDFLMDEMAGRAPTVQAGVVGAAAYGGGAGKGGKFSGLIRGKPEDLGLAKPQERFKDPVDNANDTPFVPKAWPKAHAASESRSGGAAGKHPYAAEMAAVEYSAHQLAPPADVPEPRPMEETPFTFVDTLHGLEAMHSVLMGCPEIAVDLEHHSLRSFQGFTCLMQVSTREQDFIVDTIALREHMQVLLPAFTDPSITKVFHGADMDMRWLEHDFGLYIVNLFDTGQAARVLQLPSFALAYLLDRFCGQTPDKKFQLADWRMRPLSEDMLKYARMDTHFLLFIYDKIRELLRERDAGGDRLVRSALSMSTQVAQLRYEKPVFSADAYLTVLNRSGRIMSPGQTGVFAALFAWRDELARQRDESCDFVLPTTMLFKLATAMPKTRSEVLQVCSPNVPPLVREHVLVVTNLCSAAAQPASRDAAAESEEPGAQTQAGGGAASYSLAGWVPEEEEEAEAEGSSKQTRPVPQVQLHPSNREDKAQQSCQAMFPGRRKVVLLATGDVIVGDAAHGVGTGVSAAEAAARADKVARIRASFTAEFPEALFVAPEEPAAPVSAETGGDVGMQEEVEGAGIRGLELEGVPRSIKEAFKGGKADGNAERKQQPHDSPHAADETASGGKAKKRKVGDGQDGVGEEGGRQWAQALGWKSHLRAKMAGAEGSGKEGGGDDGDDGEEEGEFNAFDYAAASAAAAPKSKRDLKREAEALLEGHFSPHHGPDGKAKQVSLHPSPLPSPRASCCARVRRSACTSAHAD